MALSRLEQVIAQLIADVRTAWGVTDGNLYLNRFPEPTGTNRRAAIILRDPVSRGGDGSGVMAIAEDYTFALHLWLPVSEGNRILLDQIQAARDLAETLKPLAVDNGSGAYTRSSSYASGVMGKTAISQIEMPPVDDVAAGSAGVTIIFTGTSWELE